MSPSLWMIFLPGISLMLFALGGEQISDTIPGQKWIRRFVLTFIYGLCVFLAGFQWWQGLAVFIVATFVFHLGYGDRASWPMKALIFAGYGLISAPIGLSWWNPITAVGCFVMMVFSNWKWLAGTFVWTAVCGLFGALIGIQISFLLAGQGLIWKF